VCLPVIYILYNLENTPGWLRSKYFDNELLPTE